MIIQFHKRFDKRYIKLSPKFQQKVDHAIEKFRKNPFDLTLGNHALTHSMKGKRAFSVTGDCRIIFKEYEDYTIVLMLDVGSHNQVY